MSTIRTKWHAWSICHACSGEGKSSSYLGDVTEMVNEDPDFAENYFAGDYDRACASCKGSGKVLTLPEPHAGAPFGLRRLWVQADRDARVDAMICAERRAEQRMGC